MQAKARVALLASAAALVVLVVFAGFRSILLLGVALAGAVVGTAAGWLVLAHRGPLRWFAVAVALAVPVVVVVMYARADLLWVVLCSLALWALAVSSGRAALADDARARMPGRPTPAPVRPFLILNPRSGGGKVGTFRIREKAEALGAEVVMLDADHPQDVAALARGAVDRGADLLGVAGGDGTQALVAGVAAERGVPFLVICAGTRNHFAMDLGLDRSDPASCLDALTDGVEMRTDLGRVGDHPFVNNASFGVYAEVVQSPAYRDDKLRTILRLLPDLLARQSGPRLTVHADGTVIEGPQAVLVSNNVYGRGDVAGLGMRTRLDAGVLGVLGVKVDSAAQAVDILRGTRSGGLTALTAREVSVDADAPVVSVGIDGEAVELPVPVRCRVEPGVLRVRVPRKRPGNRAGVPMDWTGVRRLALSMGRAALGARPGPRGGPGAMAVGDRPWRRPRSRIRVDYTGAVYGSMLAASVVVGASTVGSRPRAQLVALLLCTGVVFWAAHVYAHLFGASLANEPFSWRALRRVCATERPLVEAAVPPAAAVAISPLLGLDVTGAAWLALAVALCGQVGWAVAGAVRAGAPRRLVALSAVVNLVLGAAIVAAKTALSH
ncbi:diacylglycerol kinase family protein [Streptomyces sp. NRRL S-87]|uniref:diacylglycerol/lipid kinase family protein n=1 Tax=Streptomyces sp. NRRL S-87 TaxID=1463920 RepID=UPI0007C5472E|nr:diacylglycerol kinase family protein [Streptomyces sp. NRRL S-87]